MQSDNEAGGRLGHFYGVGVGPGDPRLLTQYAVEVFRKVDVIFHVTGPRSVGSVSGSVVDSIEGCRARRVELLFSMARDLAARRGDWERNADVVSEELRAGRDCAFASIGDPLVYSTFTYLLREVRRRLPDVRVTTVPGITSFQAAASRANMPLVENDETLTVIPAWKEELASAAATVRPGTTVFLKTYRHRDQILSSLKAGPTPAAVLYGARVGLKDERIAVGEAAVAAAPDEYLSLLIVKQGNGSASEHAGPASGRHGLQVADLGPRSAARAGNAGSAPAAKIADTSAARNSEEPA